MSNQQPIHHLTHIYSPPHAHTHCSVSPCQPCLPTDFLNKTAIDTGWMGLIRHREEQLCRGYRSEMERPTHTRTRAPTHPPHLIFRQIFITINLARLPDIKIPHIDNLLLENRSPTPAGPRRLVRSLSRRAAPTQHQIEKVSVVAHHT